MMSEEDFILEFDIVVRNTFGDEAPHWEWARHIVRLIPSLSTEALTCMDLDPYNSNWSESVQEAVQIELFDRLVINKD